MATGNDTKRIFGTYDFDLIDKAWHSLCQIYVQIRKLITFFVKCLRHHVEITLSGETPHLDITFSPIVAVSSLLFLNVAYVYWKNRCSLSTLTFIGITITSLISDSLYPSSKLWCSLDRALGSLALFLGPVRAVLYFAEDAIEQFQVIALTLFSVVFLAWSRMSKSQLEFVFRHTCWHIVSAFSLTWLAVNCPPLLLN